MYYIHGAAPVLMESADYSAKLKPHTLSLIFCTPLPRLPRLPHPSTGYEKVYIAMIEIACMR